MCAIHVESRSSIDIFHISTFHKMRFSIHLLLIPRHPLITFNDINTSFLWEIELFVVVSLITLMIIFIIIDNPTPYNIFFILILIFLKYYSSFMMKTTIWALISFRCIFKLGINHLNLFTYWFSWRIFEILYWVR